MMRCKTKNSGTMMIQFLGLFLAGLMISALAIDTSFYFAAQNQLQTAADSAALAGTDTFYRSTYQTVGAKQSEAESAATDYAEENGNTAESSDITFGFVDPAVKKYSAATFETPSSNANYSGTGGYNAVRVTVRREEGSENGPLSTIMANMFGIHTMDASATSVAFMDTNMGTMTDGGLRPFYVCTGAVQNAMQDGNLTNNAIQIYGDTSKVDGVNVTTNCPSPGSGNWGFADLRDCSSGSVGTSTFGDWIMDGYPGTVQAGQCYSTKPGNAITSSHVENALDSLIANQTVIALPVYTTWTGSGSNTNVTVSSFVGFVVTGYKSNGSASSRYIQGRFVQSACRESCSSTSSANGQGGSMAKIRLASR